MFQFGWVELITQEINIIVKLRGGILLRGY